MPEPAGRPRATVLLGALRDAGVTHVVGVPFGGAARLIAMLETGGEPGSEPGRDNARDPRWVPVTREGEAFALATGLWIGGARPAVLIQNTGLLESGDSLRGTASRAGAPLLCMVGCRGYGEIGAPRAEAIEGPASSADVTDPDAPLLTPDRLTRPDVDTVALMTEPTLRAWGIPFSRYREDGDTRLVAEALDRAERESRPAAILLEKVLK